MRARAVCVTLVAALLGSERAHAGEFDAQGEYHPSPNAVAYVDFESPPTRYLPEDAQMPCQAAGYTSVTGDDALDGKGFVRLRVDQNDGCSERFVVALPPSKGAYRATVWMRHGTLTNVQMVVAYPDGTPTTLARLFPTGRATSDGWTELASNDFPVDGATAVRAYLRVADSASADGVDLDALEIVPDGSYLAPSTCAGVGDAACGDEGFCYFGQCVLGRELVPPLPNAALRDAIVDELRSRIELFFGGHYSRDAYLPNAIAIIETMREAKTAWAFWRAWLTAMQSLHDWHTDVSFRVDQFVQPSRRLNACFIEGEADCSHAAWPSDPMFADILVSHVGQDSAGLAPGDRLVAIDGQHPLAWARSLVNVPGFHIATDPNSVADLAEALGGPTWAGALILRYATNFSVIHCDAASGTCSDVVQTIQVADLTSGTGGPDVACDNRPLYHLESDGEACAGGPCAIPDPTNHYVFDTFFRGRVSGTTPDEGIYGMVWDTLYGAGDPNSDVNANINQAVAFWKANARGIILDHRAGNGGTLDAAENLTKLVRAPEPIAVIRMPITFAGYDGPEDNAEGLAVFNALKNDSTVAYDVGDAGYDPSLPVALVLHRDGSASDYMPFGMKGAPKVRIFAPPHGTAGAFSTYISFRYFAGMTFQFASGDTIAADGSALLGHSVLPDEAILPRQSDLLAGKDTLHEAALAWVRQELKP